jgi:hypothetical protein
MPSFDIESFFIPSLDMPSFDIPSLDMPFLLHVGAGVIHSISEKALLRLTREIGPSLQRRMTQQ